MLMQTPGLPENMPPQDDAQMLSTAIDMAEHTMIIIIQLGHDHSGEWRRRLAIATRESADVAVELRCMHQVLVEEQRQQTQQDNTP
jgi:hypothetical protein